MFFFFVCQAIEPHINCNCFQVNLANKNVDKYFTHSIFYNKNYILKKGEETLQQMTKTHNKIFQWSGNNCCTSLTGIKNLQLNWWNASMTDSQADLQSVLSRWMNVSKLSFAIIFHILVSLSGFFCSSANCSSHRLTNWQQF